MGIRIRATSVRDNLDGTFTVEPDQQEVDHDELLVLDRLFPNLFD